MLDLRRGLARLGAGALAGAIGLMGVLAACRLPPGDWGLRAAAWLVAPRAAVSVWQGENAPAEDTARTMAVPPTATPVPAPSPEPHPTPAAAEPAATPAPQATSTAPPDLEDAGEIQSRFYSQGSGDGYVELAAGSIKNSTQHTDAELAEAAAVGLPFAVELNSDEPQVLILHTHATETYQTWDELVYDPDFSARTTDTSLNMCAVGDRMTEILNEAGINTVHDTTLHDSPSYTESYARSAQTARSWLEKYPSIKVVLDVHRDAIETSDGVRLKPLCEIEGQDTAQVMIIAGCDNGSTVNLPNWRQNLGFAAAWEAEMETLYPGLTRPVLCGYRFYNQDVTTGSLLIEIGGHANTLTEAVRAGEYAARALASLFGAAM